MHGVDCYRKIVILGKNAYCADCVPARRLLGQEVSTGDEDSKDEEGEGSKMRVAVSPHHNWKMQLMRNLVYCQPKEKSMGETLSSLRPRRPCSWPHGREKVKPDPWRVHLKTRCHLVSPQRKCMRS